MTIFDNAFLENLKDAIVKCNINKSLIAKLSKKAEDSKSNIEVTYDNNIDALSSNNNDIERFLYSIIPLIEKYIQNETIKKYQEQFGVDLLEEKKDEIVELKNFIDIKDGHLVIKPKEFGKTNLIILKLI